MKKILSKWILIILLVTLACSLKNKNISTYRGDDINTGTKKYQIRGDIIEPVPIWPSDYWPSLWVLAIGVSQYETQSLSLKYASKDASDIADELEKQEGKLFRKVHSKELTDHDVTRESIMASFEDIQRRAKQDDVVFIFIAGHAILTQREQDYVFLTSPTSLDDAWFKGFRWKYEFLPEIKFLLEKKMTIVICLDTCHAGAVLQGRGFEVVNYEEPFKETFHKVKSAEGLFIITACSSRERSIESDEYEQGLFTYAILNALRGKGDYNHDNQLMFTELYAYVNEKVREESNGKQNPRLIISGSDILIALIENGFVTIDIIPWGWIKIDGKDIGCSPVVDYPLSTGEHILEVEKTNYPEYKPHKGTIKIERGKQLRRTIILNQ